MNTLEKIRRRWTQNLTDKVIILDLGRADLAKLLRKLDFKMGVEVGVERGLYSETLCRENPQMKIYGVDPWESLDKCKLHPLQERTENHSSQTRCDKYYEEAVRRLTPYPNSKILKEYSVTAVKKFADNSLDFVYIDANHQYQFVLNDITMWNQKVKTGGIISGHDYYNTAQGNPRKLRVKLAVDDYLKIFRIEPLFILSKDEWPSWMWVKQ
jgi:hypothetical protein